MPKKKNLKDPVSVLVILEREELEKVDKIAGHGKRSAYIRWLLKNSNEDTIKNFALEEENKRLRQCVKALKFTLEEEYKRLHQHIKALEAKIEKLKPGKNA